MLVNIYYHVLQKTNVIYVCTYRYDTRIRPRINQSHIVKVNTTFVPQSLLHFDTSEQKFSILGYFRVRWQDEVIIWTPSNYADTNYIKVPVSEIWRPGLIILKVRLLLPHDSLNSAKRQMTIFINCHREILPRPRIESANINLQI